MAERPPSYGCGLQLCKGYALAMSWLEVAVRLLLSFNGSIDRQLPECAVARSWYYNHW